MLPGGKVNELEIINDQKEKEKVLSLFQSQK